MAQLNNASAPKEIEIGRKMTITLVVGAVFAMMTYLLPPGAAGVVMHHVTSCSQCGKSPQGKPGSWCDDPLCLPFRFDEKHVAGPDVSLIGCAALGPHPTTFCLNGGGDIFAATNSSVPCLHGPCPPPPPVPPPPPTPVAFHVAAHRGANDVNAVFEYKGVAHMFRQGDGGWQHYTSADFVSWKPLPTVLGPGGWDGSLTMLPGPSGGPSSAEPVVLYDCVTVADCRPKDTASAGPDAGAVGDPPIIGVARPANLSDPQLAAWVKDARNPIAVADSPPTFSGPSNLWRRADGAVDFVMILGKTTGLFRSTDPDLHNWTLVTPSFFPTRGGGGGLFFPLPAPGGGASGFTHMLQSDFRDDGTAFFALGRYDEANDSFVGVRSEPASLDRSSSFRFFELGYRADGSLLCAGWIVGMGTSITRVVGWVAMQEALTALPVPEVAALRGAVLGRVDAPTPLQPGVARVIAASGALVADAEIAVAVPPSGGNITVSICGAVNLVLTANATQAGVGQAVVVSGHVPTMIGSPTFFINGDEGVVSVRALVDTNVVELFVGGGLVVVSVPGLRLALPGEISVTASTEGVSLANATVWAMPRLW